MAWVSHAGSMTHTEETIWDSVVIGGGAAGLSAAQALGRSLRRTLVIDGGLPRNRFAARMHNALALDGTPPSELVARGRAEAEAYGVVFREGDVTGVREAAGEASAGGAQRLVVEIDSAAGTEIHTTRSVIAATGITDELPAIPGLAERWGRSVLHCPYCHGWEVRNRRIAVLATSPLGMHHAKLLRQWTDDLLVFSAELGPIDETTAAQLAARDVRLEPSRVIEVLDADRTAERTGAVLVRTESGREHVVDAIFTMGTAVPHDGFLAALDLEREETPLGSFITVDPIGRTSHPRVWAAGNVVAPTASVPLVAGAGMMAGAAVNGALVEEDFAHAAPPAQGGVAADHGHDHAGPGFTIREGEAPAEFWERRYAESESVWSGRVNATLAHVVSGFAPGRALDLGCGEGGDAIWLAEQGWEATGIDLSPTAVARARAVAEERAPGRTAFIAADLGDWAIRPGSIDGADGSFDLVTASFMQSPVEFPRDAVLRAAAARVAEGGHLVVISHASAPVWAEGHHGPGDFPSPAEELATLDLDPEQWRVLTAEVRSREATGPGGRQAMLDDTVVVAERLG